MKNDEYWQRRAEQRLVEAEQIAARAEKEIHQAFDEAYKNIELQIYRLYGKYATDNHLSYADTLLYLTNNELAEFQQDVAFYIENARDKDYRTAFKTYLQALSTRARIKRLEAYQAQLKMIGETLYTEEIVPRTTEVIQTVVREGYLKAAFDLSQGLGMVMAFDQPSQRLIKQVLEYPWSGKNFSRKWWDNCDNFEAVLDETLTKGLVMGLSNQKMARELRDKTEASYNRALRLVRTETNFAYNQATAAMYEDLAVEKYKYLATLDLRTSPMCREMDGKIIAYADKIAGINYPPLHPWCRSTTVPVIYEDEISMRVARDKDGKTYKVPRDMTYKEWYAKYVANDPEMLKQEKMIRNQASDKAMYERYREVLGSHAPKSFEKFQQMKYNDKEKWSFTKLDYSRRNELIDHPEMALPNAQVAKIADEKFSKYLFNPDNPKGYAKGQAITSRLGYDANNYEAFKKMIAMQAKDYPAVAKQKDDYGVRYEQKMVVYGVNGQPANLIVGWNVTNGETKLTSTYIKEVK